MEVLCNLISSYRSKRGITISQLSSDTGISVELITQLEKFSGTPFCPVPSIRSCLHLALYFNCGVDELFYLAWNGDY